MNYLLSLAVAYILSFGGYTASGQTGKISLVVTDKQQKNIGSTFVELLNAKDSSLVQYAITDKQGNLDFPALKPGKYIVYVPQANGKNYISQPVAINHLGEEYTLSVIVPNLMPNNAVIVTAPAPFYLGASSRA